MSPDSLCMFLSDRLSVGLFLVFTGRPSSRMPSGADFCGPTSGQKVIKRWAMSSRFGSGDRDPGRFHESKGGAQIAWPALDQVRSWLRRLTDSCTIPSTASVAAESSVTAEEPPKKARSLYQPIQAWPAMWPYRHCLSWHMCFPRGTKDDMDVLDELQRQLCLDYVKFYLPDQDDRRMDSWHAAGILCSVVFLLLRFSFLAIVVLLDT